MIFMNNPPEGTTIHYDNFRLGALERDTIPFIPYAERMDMQRDHQRPHAAFPLRTRPEPRPAPGVRHQWRNRRPGGCRAYAAHGHEPERGHMGSDVDANNLGIADHYGQRGTSSEDCMLVQRYVASSMQSPGRFDAMILTTPGEWCNLPRGDARRLLRPGRERWNRPAHDHALPRRRETRVDG